MKNKERTFLLVSMALNLALVAFFSFSSSSESATSADTEPEPTVEPTATAISSVSGRPQPGAALLPPSIVTSTSTPIPTHTPLPTDTPLPTPTNTPLPTETPTLTPSPTQTPSPTLIPQPEWLTYINTFRQMVGLPDLANNVEWSEDSRLHSIYMVNTNDITHHPNTKSEWFTARGELAGENGNIAATVWNEAAYIWAINYWMSAPFHGLPILDPELETVGFGVYTAPFGEIDDSVNFAATLDVLRGLGEADPNAVEFPIIFPPDGGQTWILRHSLYEWPSPLDACSGYERPTGPPIMIQTGFGDGEPVVTDYTLTENGRQIFGCMFHEGNYTSDNPSAQNSGVGILNARDAVVVIPFNPLVVGNVYKLTITINGETYTTEFTAVDPPYATD